jgi:hypothetical protein
MVLTRSMTKNIAKKQQPIKSLFNKPKVNLKEEFSKLRERESATHELTIQRRKKRSANPDSPNQPQHSKSLQYNATFVKYLGDIEEITGIPISTRQKELIKKAIEFKKYTKLSKSESQTHRREYSSKRKELIAEWEKETGREWGRYTEPVYSRNGKLVRNVGDTYDAHHIILCSWGGNNEFWNFIPARFPIDHQEKIHRKGGYCDQIFGGGS